MKYTLDQIKQVLKNKNYLFFDNKTPYNLNIIGIRESLLLDGFNDEIYLIYRDNLLRQKIESFPITTEPGRFYLEHPMNPEGTFILMPGQYLKSHKIGLHRGLYKALVQVGKLRGYMDNDKDDVFDLDPEVTKEGVFGINIHKAGKDSIQVDNWSAGCQVFKKEKDFDYFMSLCDKSAGKFGNIFSYTLLESKDFEV